jgi:hypothetical protein
MRFAVAVAFVAVVAACGGRGDEAHFAQSRRTIEVAPGDSFVVDLDEGWRLAQPEDLSALGSRIEQTVGVKQVTYPADGDPGMKVPEERWVGDVAFEVFLNLDVTDLEQRLIDEALLDDPDVDADGIDFISHEEQYEQFVEYFKDQPQYTRNVAPEDLPASFRVSPIGRTIDRKVLTLVREGDGQLHFVAMHEGETSIVLRKADDKLVIAVKVG